MPRRDSLGDLGLSEDLGTGEFVPTYFLTDNVFLFQSEKSRSCLTHSIVVVKKKISATSLKESQGCRKV